MTERKCSSKADDKTYTPVLPFDSTFGEYFSTYDTKPYVCDRDRCHSNIAKNSGNILKYYEYNVEEEKVIISE